MELKGVLLAGTAAAAALAALTEPAPSTVVQLHAQGYITRFPDSNFAKVINNAVVYSSARTTSPSDSYPATAAHFAGRAPRHTGIWWDDVWDRSLYPAGSACQGPPGAGCDWSGGVDLNGTSFDGGYAFDISKLPLQKTAWGTCEVVYPHNFIRVNTVFEVGRSNGLVTAYADKHPTYEYI